MNGLEFRRALRANVTGFGNYGPPMLVLLDGECFCWKCVNDEKVRICCAAMNKNRYRDGWTPLSFEMHWEGEDIACANCGEFIVSVYGDPNAQTD